MPLTRCYVDDEMQLPHVYPAGSALYDENRGRMVRNVLQGEVEITEVSSLI